MNSTENKTILEDILQSTSEWSNLKLLLFIFLSLTCIATIIGNLLVIITFLKSERLLRSPIHFLLFNLAVADLLVGLFVMPGLTSVTVFDFKWYFGKIPCILQDYLHFTLCATSMLSMVAVCLERYVGLKYPMHHKRILNKRRVRFISLTIWLLAICLTALPLNIWRNRDNPSKYFCPPNLRTDFIFFISVSLYWIPILIMIYIYYLIYKVSKIPSAELMKWANKSIGSTAHSTVSTVSKRKGSSEEERWEKARKKQNKILKNISKLVAIMLLFYGPLFGLFLLKSFDIDWFSLNNLLAFAWLRYFSSCSNTFLYVYVMPYYKKELLKLVCNVRSGESGKSEGTSQDVSSSNGGRSVSFSSSSDGAVKVEVGYTETSAVTCSEDLSGRKQNHEESDSDDDDDLKEEINRLDSIMAKIKGNL